MPSFDECMAAVKAAGRNVSDDEIEQIFETLNDVRQRRKATANLTTLEEDLLDAADELGAEAVEAAKIEKRNALINIKIKGRLRDYAGEVEAATGNVADAVTAKTVGVNQRFQGARDSVDARGSALAAQYHGGMIRDLEEAGLLAQFNARHLDRPIAQELAEITKRDGNPGVSGSDEARQIAAIIDKYRRASVSRENRAGAWIKPLEGYVTRQTHDMARLRRSGFEAWKEFIVPLLDERTFVGVDNREAFLRGSYDGLASGRHLKFDGPSDTDNLFAFKGPGNLAKRTSAHRKLHFKTADAWSDYNERFGTRSLVEAIVQDLERSARNTALMETFGTNPRAMFDAWVDELKDTHRGDLKQFDALASEGLGYQFSEIDGTARIPVSPSLAHFGAVTRATLTMAKLGGAFLSSITDLGFKAAAIHQTGTRNILQTWGANLSSTLKGMAPGEARQTANLIGVGLDGMVGDLAARFSATDDLPGRMSKLMQVYFKLNMLGPWTDANKRGVGLMMANDLAGMAGKRWDRMPAETKSMLQLYGMDATRWDIARRAARTEADGRAYLMPDAVQDLPDDAFTPMIRAEKPSGKITARDVRAAKDALETSLRAYYVDRTEFAVPTPGARERAIMRLGTRPGTPMGEAARFVMQFKAFPITVLTKGLGGMMQADSHAQFFRNLVNGTGDRLGLAHMIASMTVLGYVAMAAKDAVKGRSPRDPSLPGTWQAALLQGGGMGIYGDFIMGDFSRFGRTPVETLAGPALSEFGSLVELLQAVRNGDDAAAKALRVLMNNTPFLNLWYTRTALDYLVLYNLQEAANPGYLKRMERRAAKENNQRYLVAPSEVVPRGGGAPNLAAIERLTQ